MCFYNWISEINSFIFLFLDKFVCMYLKMHAGFKVLSKACKPSQVFFVIFVSTIFPGTFMKESESSEIIALGVQENWLF